MMADVSLQRKKGLLGWRSLGFPGDIDSLNGLLLKDEDRRTWPHEILLFQRFWGSVDPGKLFRSDPKYSPIMLKSFPILITRQLGVLSR